MATNARQSPTVKTKSCHACWSVLLRWMERSERQFSPSDLEWLMHHPPCSMCQGKPGREFVCRVCSMLGARRATEVVIRRALSPEQIDRAIVNGGVDEAPDPSFFRFGAPASSAQPGADRPKAKENRSRDPATLKNRIVKLLGGELEYYTVTDAQGRRRGQRTRLRLFSNAEIAAREGCTPQYVGQVKEDLARDERSNDDLRVDGDVKLMDLEGEIVTPDGRLLWFSVATSKKGAPTIRDALALKEKRFAKSSEDQARRDQEYVDQLIKTIRASRRHFRTG